MAVTPQQACAETIVPTYDTASFIAAGYSVAAVENAFQYVINEYQSRYTDPVTVNITVQAGSTGLGESDSAIVAVGGYAAMKAALLADYAANPDAIRAVAGPNLPASDPTGGGTFWVTTADAKALGLLPNSSASDGTFIFSNTQSYTFDPNNRQVPGEFDFIGVAEHEVSEIMGRISLLGDNIAGTSAYTDNDLFRFTAPGVRSESSSAAGVYLSYDNGVTNLAGFNSGGGDHDDYDGANATDPYNASTGPGQGHMLNSVDNANMDIIGWDLTSGQGAAPEPATLTLLGLGIAGMAGYGWRQRKQVVA